jgi:hypothetical protein
VRTPSVPGSSGPLLHPPLSSNPRRRKPTQRHESKSPLIFVVISRTLRTYADAFTRRLTTPYYGLFCCQDASGNCAEDSGIQGRGQEGELMLRIMVCRSAEDAEHYHDVALARSDSHAKDIGIWGGKLAERLNLLLCPEPCIPSWIPRGALRGPSRPFRASCCPKPWAICLRNGIWIASAVPLTAGINSLGAASLIWVSLSNQNFMKSIVSLDASLVISQPSKLPNRSLAFSLPPLTSGKKTQPNFSSVSPFLSVESPGPQASPSCP